MQIGLHPHHCTVTAVVTRDHRSMARDDNPHKTYSARVPESPRGTSFSPLFLSAYSKLPGHNHTLWIREHSCRLGTKALMSRWWRERARREAGWCHFDMHKKTTTEGVISDGMAHETPFLFTMLWLCHKHIHMELMTGGPLADRRQ